MVIRSTTRVTSEDMPRPSQSPYNPPPARVRRAWGSPTATITDKLATRLWVADTLATLQWTRHDVDLACALGVITPRQATRLRAITPARSLVLAIGRGWTRLTPDFLGLLRFLRTICCSPHRVDGRAIVPLLPFFYLLRFLRNSKVVKGW